MPLTMSVNRGRGRGRIKTDRFLRMLKHKHRGMDVSCVWFCHSQLRCFTGTVLLLLICLSTLMLLFQSLYLHVTLGESFYMSVFAAKKNQLDDRKPEMPFNYHAFGRPQAMVKFQPENNEFKYKTLDKDAKFTIFKHPKLFDSYYNGNMTIHRFNPFAYYKASNNNVYITSAFDRGRFSADSMATLDDEAAKYLEQPVQNNIVMTGWIAYEKINKTLLCCLLKENNTVVIQNTNTKRIVWTQVKKQQLMAVKLTCPLPQNIPREKITGATVTVPVERCNKKTFVQIERAHRASFGSIALCSKIAYGTLSAQRLVEWLEIQRYIGVDKILIYVYNLNKEAMLVLKHYAEDGLVDIVPFDIPKPEIKRYVGQKEAQPFIDEQVVVFDCMERLRGYTYVGVMDMDEVLYTRISPEHNLKHLMERLHRRSPLAAGFSFRTELFITEWPTRNLTAGEALFWHSSHQNRTRPLVDRVKNLLMMDRVVLASVWTHNFTAKPGFDRYPVPASVATLQHYRPCRANWHCSIRRGYRDRGISSIVAQLKDTLLGKFDLLKVIPKND